MKCDVDGVGDMSSEVHDSDAHGRWVDFGSWRCNFFIFKFHFKHRRGAVCLKA